MSEKLNQNQLRSHALWQAQPEIYDAVLNILYRNDPVGICTPDNPWRETEYEYEIETILPRLKGAASENEMLKIVHEEFVHWFNGSAGPQARYSQVAAEIWELIRTSG